VTGPALRPRAFEDVLRGSTFDFIGSGRHGTTREEPLSICGGVALDARVEEEVDVASLGLAPEVAAVHIPARECPDRVCGIREDRPVAFFFTAGIRAAMVYVRLRTSGFGDPCIPSGGLSEQARSGLPGAIWKRGHSTEGAS